MRLKKKIVWFLIGKTKSPMSSGGLEPTAATADSEVWSSHNARSSRRVLKCFLKKIDRLSQNDKLARFIVA